MVETKLMTNTLHEKSKHRHTDNRMQHLDRAERAVVSLDAGRRRDIGRPKQRWFLNSEQVEGPLGTLLLLLLTAIGLSPGGSGYFTCKQILKKKSN